MSKIVNAIYQLVAYATHHHLIDAADQIYCLNRITHIVQEPISGHGITVPNYESESLDALFSQLFTNEKKASLGLEYVYQVESMRAAIMDVFMMKPTAIADYFLGVTFQSGKERLSAFYDYAKKTDYIKENKDIFWKTPSIYGDIEITINRSKPEKDNKEIAALLTKPISDTDYPVCPLCIENVGYYGDIHHAARSNHRVLPLTIGGEDWSFQFSPYGYYNEHAIVLNNKHTPMTVCSKSISQLLDFLEQYPHYFIGSNAGLPIVGGSILNHDHFQAGDYEFPMMRAETCKTWDIDGIKIEQLHWPLSVIKISAQTRDEIERIATAFFDQWTVFEAPSQLIWAQTDGIPHNAITPVVRNNGEMIECYLALRNNKTSTYYPDGIFHPHQEIHPIKKENIGLIEVMGYAILPPRLIDAMTAITKAIKEKQPFPDVYAQHHLWAMELLQEVNFKGLSIEETVEKVKQKIGQIFTQGLEHCGVFKTPENLTAFIEFVIEGMDD